MYLIENNKIKVSRGDAFTTTFDIEGYTFKEDDVLKLAVFEQGSTFEDALVTITGDIDLENNRTNFSFEEDDTLFSDPISEPETYSFEIKLNGDQTVLGYDDDGAKEFILYPAEVGDKNAK